MKHAKNLLNNISSKYCLKQIFDYCDKKKVLNIIKLNKNLQSKLNIGIHSYLFYKIYNKLDENEEFKLNNNENDDSILNLVEKNINNKKMQEKIIKDFFEDIYNNYFKTPLIIYYNSENFNKDNFHFLSTIKNIPTKFYIKVNLEKLKEYEEKDKKIFSQESIKSKNIKKNSILNLLDYYNSIYYGFDFEFEHFSDDLGFKFPEIFLNKINKIFENIEYLRIPCELIKELLENNMFCFFKNKFKKVEIYDYNVEHFDEFIDIFNENRNKLNNLLEVDKLIIKLLDDDYINEGSLNLCKIKGIKNLELYGITYAYDCDLDKDTLQTLNNFVVYNTYICFDEEYIKFTNLISLEIREVNLDYIFEKKKFDFNSFPKLQELIIGISSVIDYIFLIKLLKSLKYLKELTIFNNSILLDEEYEYAHYFNKYASNIIPDVTIYDEALDKQSEILGNTIIEL